MTVTLNGIHILPLADVDIATAHAHQFLANSFLTQHAKKQKKNRRMATNSLFIVTKGESAYVIGNKRARINNSVHT